MNNKKSPLMTAKKLLSGGKQNIVIIFAAIALFAIFTLINSGFASSSNLLTMTKALVPYAILALGVTFVIATGGIDLSIGTVCIGSAVLAGALCSTGVTTDDGILWLTIPVILVTGLVFGLINGLLVAKCKIAPFIATLGTMLVSRGITSVVSEAVRSTSAAVKYPTTGWMQKIFTNYEGFPIGLVWVLVLTIICAVVTSGSVITGGTVIVTFFSQRSSASIIRLWAASRAVYTVPLSSTVSPARRAARSAAVQGTVRLCSMRHLLTAPPWPGGWRGSLR